MSQYLFPSFVIALMLAGCAPPQTTGSIASPPGPAPSLPAPVPFAQAVLNAGNAVLAVAAGADAGRTVVIDPLVNGVTGEQSASTRAIGTQLADLGRARYPQLRFAPFSAAAVATAPLVMIGTFTPVDARNQPAGLREAYRFCLVMADLKSGKIAAKSVARAVPAGVDATPTRAFADSPAWTSDASTKAYIDTCQATKAGDPIPLAYVNGIIAAALVNQAMEAYEAAHYREALDLYEQARLGPGGDQLRVYTGLYLARTKLGQRDQAQAAFGQLVDYGLRNNRLAIKLLFRPGSTAFIADPAISGPYPMWLQQVAEHSARSNACLQVTGHTSASGSAVLNDRLSVLRAEYVKTRLEQDEPALHNRTVATGVGAQQPLVGTGADDASDVLDRRVEFAAINAC